MRVPRSIIALAVLAASLTVLVAGCGGGSGDTGTATGRSAAAQPAAEPIPSIAYIGTGGTTVTGLKPALVRCQLTAERCTALRSFGDPWAQVEVVQYMAGRLYARLAGTLEQAIVSCPATSAGSCTELLRVNAVQVDLVGPVAGGDGRLLVSALSSGQGRPDGLYSCDPATTRSIGDCRKMGGVPRVQAMAPLGTDSVVIATRAGTADPTLLACTIADGACRELGTAPWLPDALYAVPRFDRVYFGYGKQMWSCDTAGSGGCKRQNTFGSFVGAFTSNTEYVFAGTRYSVMKCSPTATDSCSALSTDTDVSSLAMSGESVLVGTYDASAGFGRGDGGLYRRPIAGGGGGTVWGGTNSGGVKSLDFDTSDPTSTLTTTVVRYTPRGSRVTATGRVTISPAPLSGDAQCVLPPPELPVTCTSTFPKGTKVTLTAIPGPSSALNTWEGAAGICNEPGGPGTPPATTCTLTMISDGVATAGFRPADQPKPTPTTPTTPTTPEPTPTVPTTTGDNPPTPPEPTPPAPTPPAPQPEPIPTPPGPAPAPNAPLAITGLSVTRQAFTPTQGTQVRYRLTQPAAVTMTFTYGTGTARGTRYTYRIKAGRPGARAGNNRVRIRGVVKGQSVRTGRWVMKVSAAKGTQRAQAKARTLRVRR